MVAYAHGAHDVYLRYHQSIVKIIIFVLTIRKYHAIRFTLLACKVLLELWLWNVIACICINILLFCQE